jgi:hypothetical protein
VCAATVWKECVTMMVDQHDASGSGGGNRRITNRQKTLKSAKIVFNKKQSVIDCFVRDLSDTGAKLQVADLVAVPKTFTLLFHDGAAHECERVRAMGTEIGVRFLR